MSLRADRPHHSPIRMTVTDVVPRAPLKDQRAPGGTGVLAQSPTLPGPRPTASSAAYARQLSDHDPRALQLRHQAMAMPLGVAGSPTKAAIGIDQALPVLSSSFDTFAGKDGKVTRSDFQRVANDPSATPEQRATAAYFLASPTAMAYLDTGRGKGKVDGQIGREDVAGVQAQLTAVGGTGGKVAGVQGAIDTTMEASAVFAKYDGWADTAGGKGGRDGKVSNADLQAILDDPNAPRDLKQAALVLYADRVNTGNSSGGGGGIRTHFPAGGARP